MSLRYFAGHNLVLFSRLLKAILSKAYEAAALAEKFSVIVWTPRELDRYSRADWNSPASVQGYSDDRDTGLTETEEFLIEKYFVKSGRLLNLACGAGREALPLARRGLSVMASDWAPRMIAEARRRARAADLPISFALADMYALPYREQTFDYLLLTNIAYSHLFPRRRRIRFLQQAHAVLKPGGVFIISFARAGGGFNAFQRLLERLFVRLRQWAPFNREYEPGDVFTSVFIHFFQPEELRQEFEEAQFIVKDWLWERGYAVLVKP